MFEDTLLIIKPDYLAKSKPLILHLLQHGFFIKAERKIYFTPELAAEFYDDRAEDADFMFQIILLSKGNSEAFILCKEQALNDLIAVMVCYFGSSSVMEERVHVSQCPNKVRREISFIFPNYIQEPILLFEQAKFCADNPVIEKTINALYDIVTNPKKEEHKSWQEKLAESLIGTNRDLPNISNLCSYNLDLNKQDTAQQTDISSLMIEGRKDNALRKTSSNDISKNCSSLNFTTSSCLSCSGFESGAVCFQRPSQNPLEQIVRDRTANLEALRQSSASSMHTELNIEDKAIGEELCDNVIGHEVKEDNCETNKFSKIDIVLVKDTSCAENAPSNDFVNKNDTMPVDNSTYLLKKEDIASIENVLPTDDIFKGDSEESLILVKQTHHE